ncbi:MAG TPA: Uma2 family endonuclease [Bryobacterales bacterium]|nr:Uma2 family endonuclease [Bryobacterales bacterium]
MPAAPVAISVDEYLHTSFPDGDREYIDGVIVERNLGEKDHSRTQRELILFFGALRATHATFAFPEQRVQVKPTRFRVPDVCVYIGSEPAEQVFRTPPFLVVEILSPDDRATAVQEKIDDYLACGVQFIWIIDPRTRRGYIHAPEGSHEAKDSILRTANPAIDLPLHRLFD